jgi:hypothetical protein
MAGQIHEIEKIALAYVKCVCGWSYRIEALRGKTDEDLSIECGRSFEKHKKSAKDKW